MTGFKITANALTKQNYFNLTDKPMYKNSSRDHLDTGNYNLF